ncbi:MAG: CinA family protein [bacterium]
MAERAALAKPLTPLELSQAVGQALKARGESLAVAESCTGGALSDIITAIPGSSDYFLGGVVTYSPRAKQSVLNVPAALLKEQGIVSKGVAISMAQNVRSLLNTTWGIGITGVAGPGTDAEGNPAGLVFCAVASARSDTCERFIFNEGAGAGDPSRDAVKRSAAEAALRTLLRELEKAA